MKTLVVLSALASLAIAAPTLLEDSFKSTQPSEVKFPEHLDQQKKSIAPPEDSSLSSGEEGHSSTHDLTTNTKNINSEAAMGRTFISKKPIIIKKKHGYHLYRDSDEEQAQADPQESCNKQVKVKLCDDKNFVKSDDNMRSVSNNPSSNHQVSITQGDMQQRIQMAKEAVESLQRDLQEMETNSDSKLKHGKHGKSESDIELHEDIEEARQALDHFHKSFGNLESMNLHATASKDAESLHDLHFTIAKTEEERLAQWKQALNNINKNVEIARNIEDSFKSSENKHDEFDDSMVNKNEQLTHKNLHKTSDKEALENIKSKEAVKEELNRMSETIAADDKTTSKGSKMEMKSSNTEDLKIKDQKKHETDLKSDQERHDNQNTQITANSSTLSNDAMRPTEQIQENKSEIGAGKFLKQNTESSLDSDMSASETKMKTTELNSNFENNAETKWNNMDHNSIKEKNALGKSTEMNSIKKGTELTGAVNEKQNHLEQKTADSTNSQFLLSNPEQSGMIIENLEEQKSALQKPVEHLADKMSPDHNGLHTQTIRAHENMKLIREQKSATNDQKNMHWALDSHNNIETMQLKSPGAGMDNKMEFHNLEHLRKAHPSLNSQQAAHEQHHHEMSSNVHHSPAHLFLKSHGDMKMGKSADFDMAMHPSMQPSVNQPFESIAFDNGMFQLKKAHEAARSAYAPGAAYGAPAAEAPGAIGVFPHANVGGCAIPFLLSCSPSLTPGNLSKGHPSSYGSPAYRNADDFNFHIKREIDDKKLVDQAPPIKVKRTLTTVKHKPTTLLEKKQ